MPCSVLPRPPYHVVIFRYRRNGEDAAGYEAAHRNMLDTAQRQAGCLGVETIEGAGGDGVTLSYWSDEASIRAWRAQDARCLSREKDRRGWYAQYALQVAQVERAYDWSHNEANDSAPAPVV
ncbi:conserved hypothetical protein [Luteimonas sp. 9C]|uniref:antibiotic biosynthesis monooxygenase family protein n=1 Tax=Luteimonas sp. 9C TaxID=2653148 RepID=UPI0012F1F005|nr:antibiotic biosynthesis monooxygenase [Luteimonas sp. 9C]VXA93665.1 conserved hypothetical protein [Luteimonas sp. 9C]